MKNKTYFNDLPWLLILSLAAFGALKTLVQVLGMHQSEGVIWLATLALWFGVVIARKIPRPFTVLLMTGIVSGLISIIIQQIAWAGYWDHSLAVTISNEQNNLPFNIVLGDTAIRTIAATITLTGTTLGGAILGAIVAGIERMSQPKR